MCICASNILALLWLSDDQYLMRKLCNAASGSCRRLAMKVFVVTVLYFLSYCFVTCFFFFFFFFLSWLYFHLMLVSTFPGLNNLLMAYDDKSAYALCAFSFALGPNAEPITFLGKTPVNPSSFMILYSDEELRCTYIYICFQQFNSNNLPIYLTMI
jgi:hypothetical protein